MGGTENIPEFNSKIPQFHPAHCATVTNHGAGKGVHFVANNFILLIVYFENMLMNLGEFMGLSKSRRLFLSFNPALIRAKQFVQKISRFKISKFHKRIDKYINIILQYHRKIIFNCIA